MPRSLHKNPQFHCTILSYFLPLRLSTSVQKEASRVARYKVKQDFLSNPEKLAYVDDEFIKQEPDVKVETKKKPNFVKFLIQAYKDNKEYKQYKKEHDIEQLKLTKAREEIELTPEQEKRAIQLQNNVFKMFNKADEKSQVYSESTEALGEITQTVGGLVGMIPGLLGYAKSLKDKNIAGSVISVVCAFVPTFALNILVTKEQKSASKVADMLAINEMDDYKHFADYSNNNSASSSEQQDTKKEEPQKAQKQQNIQSPMLQQALN